jgi:hypothetical protein
VEAKEDQRSLGQKRASPGRKNAGGEGQAENPFKGKKIYYYIDILAVRQGYSAPGMGIHNHHMLPDFQYSGVIKKAKVCHLPIL